MARRFILLIVFSVFYAYAFAEVDLSTCEKSLANIREPNISCIVYLKLSEREKNELKVATSEAIHNLSCEVLINTNKADIVRALSEPHVKIPTMPVKCNVKFNDGTNKIAAFDVAPEFVFQENNVINASLNIGEVSGIGFLGVIVKNQLSSDKTNKQLADAANQAIKKLAQ